MNISPQNADLPLVNVANQATASLRRDNQQRDLITRPEPSAQSGAEKGVASDADKSQTPGQNVDLIDFESIQEQIELESSTVNENPEDANEQASQQGEEELAASEENTEAEEPEELPPEVEFAEEIEALEQRDQEVRVHEQAHAAAGGQYAGTPQYQYTQGPDGQRYVTDGQVSIDTSVIAGDPEATINKLQQVVTAALAPAEPSTQDRRVASQASQQILQAQTELAAQRAEELEAVRSGGDESDSAISNTQGNNGPDGNISASINTGEDTLANTDSNANDFDQFINSTITAQEQVSPSRSEEVDARANRIERFYGAITDAYDERPSSNFQIAV